MRKPTRMAHAVLLATGAVFTTAAMLTVLPTGKAVAGIAETKHNLGSAVTSQSNNYFTDGSGAGNQANNEICVFCHTPHGADTTAAVPLWNKSLAVPRTGAYSMYSELQTATFDADEAEIGSVSLACLSCHDGTQAMDNIINAPLSGGYSSDGGGADGRTFGMVSSRGTMNTAAGKMQNSEASGFIPMLGTDLTNDHPISMSYCGGNSAGVADASQADIIPSNVCKDEDFATAVYKQINTKDYWFVEASGDATATRDKNDMILYTRTVGPGAGSTYIWPTVECGSCHDPHTTTATFLRVADVADAATSSGRLASGATGAGNAYSAVCLACHVK